MQRRRLIAGAAGVVGFAGAAAFIAVPSSCRAVGGADTEARFALGVASGQPRSDSVVLWTRLTGSDLPATTEVTWQLADDERFERIVASGNEIAHADEAHSVHAEPGGLEPARWYFYRFMALGQRSQTGRTRTAPAADAAVATLRFAIASCQRWDAGHYAAWRHIASQNLDLLVFLGDYIYETPSRLDSIRRHEGGLARTLAQYRARYATYKSDPLLQAAHASAPWLMVWDDHEVSNDYADMQNQRLDTDFEARRAAAYRSYWEHMPFPKAMRPTGPDMRIYGHVDWGHLARFHLLDDRQYRDPQACPRPGRGGSNTVRRDECAALTDPKRSLLGDAQERWLDEGWDTTRSWNLVAQQTLMARFSWRDRQRGVQGGAAASDGDERVWTDGWEGYAPARRRLLDGVAERRAQGVVVLGGDVHSHYVADLRRDADDTASPIVATEFCGTSISSLSSLDQTHLDAARRFNPHIRYARSDRRGYVSFEVDANRLSARLHGVDDPHDPRSSVSVLARFTVQADRPGAIAA